jgi:hypothetical protein
MNARAKLVVGVGALIAVGVAGAVALAQGGNDFKERLTGYQEVPALSTSGNGTFRASIRNHGTAINYKLTYAGLEGKPLQAHIHLGQRGVNAGVIVAPRPRASIRVSSASSCERSAQAPPTRTCTRRSTRAARSGPS